MSALFRPPTPQYLREATLWLFGRACLRCGIEQPLNVAHIVDWSRCRELASTPVSGIKRPRWFIEGEALRLFHSIGNVLPLCSNCHDLYDGREYDVAEAEIRGYRDAAVQRRDVLLRAVDYVATELSARPNRCQHQDDGKRVHSHQVDLVACVPALCWIFEGYRSGVLTEEPAVVVRRAGGGHHHARLDQGQVVACLGSWDSCRQGNRVIGRPGY